MKKNYIITSCVLIVGIIFSGLTFADSQRTGYRKHLGFKQHYNGGGLRLLAGYQQRNIKFQVLAEMTEQSVEAIQLKLKDQPMRSVMQELKIDRQAFRDAIQAKERERINRAVSDGSITPEQEKEILVKMETHAKRRELLRKLIEKGIEDGTITRDDARMLMRKQR